MADEQSLGCPGSLIPPGTADHGDYRPPVERAGAKLPGRRVMCSHVREQVFEVPLLRREGKMEIRYDKGMPPTEVARGVLDALQKGRATTVLGREARWILRVNRFLPRLVDRLLARAVRRLYANPS